MKFEQPTMRISKFRKENVVTDSTIEPTTGMGLAESKADELVAGVQSSGGVAAKIRIEF